MKAFTSMEDSGTQWLAGKEKANKRIQGTAVAHWEGESKQEWAAYSEGG